MQEQLLEVSAHFIAEDGKERAFLACDLIRFTIFTASSRTAHSSLGIFLVAKDLIYSTAVAPIKITLLHELRSKP